MNTNQHLSLLRKGWVRAGAVQRLSELRRESKIVEDFIKSLDKKGSKTAEENLATANKIVYDLNKPKRNITISHQKV